jgi:hypothetical protein
MDAKISIVNDKLLIGRNEWCELPDLHIPAIKAKIDTGAKTSALHAFDIEPFQKNNKHFVHFKMYPLQGNDDVVIDCIAPLIDERHIMSSSGHIEHRCVILTTVVIAGQQWEIQVTLSNRDPLRYRLLLGREALNNRVLIDPNLTCHQKKISRKKALHLYLNR